MTAPTPKSPFIARLQDGVLVLIVLLVGAMAGAASFNHVHDWTISNSPTGTADWFGWANAVITELIPIAAMIVIIRRRKTGGPIGYPMFLLIAAVGLSLTAQLAVAKPTVFGWMVSALPALAFFALSKLVFTATRPTNHVPAPVPATSAPASSPDITADAKVRPAAATTATAPTEEITTDEPATEAKKNTPAIAAPQTTPTEDIPAPATPPAAPAIPAVKPAPALLSGARIVADAHAKAHGEPITPGQLAVRLRVPTQTAADILMALTTQPTINDKHHNGTAVGASA
ncbi:hypothetical protein [Micromonospora ureilytica]|uniref:DUF2637 domain-containing protein n=1 Tax=Micromonospora ureilytica TaxID=709868 RepID=A0ABS0JQP7_9ACTN|nr:hypothetical protein [Micromonospora ureilytica]MBG6069372.1 hypothetical protein [Micromonospora ureilytica]